MPLLAKIEKFVTKHFYIYTVSRLIVAVLKYGRGNYVSP